MTAWEGAVPRAEWPSLAEAQRTVDADSGVCDGEKAGDGVIDEDARARRGRLVTV